MDTFNMFPEFNSGPSCGPEGCDIQGGKMNSTLISIARKAREVLKRDGWVKGELHGVDGGHCAIGAVDQVMQEVAKFSPDSRNKVLFAMAKTIDPDFDPDVAGTTEDYYSPGGSSYSESRAVDAAETIIAEYNDATETQEDDVLRVFNQSIRNLKEGVGAFA